MIDYIARMFLIAAHTELFFAAFIVVGFIFGDKQKFGHIFLLLFFTLIFNGFLKSFFQEPLAAHINHPGWSHPSGHMQTSMVFWGSVCWEFRKRWLYLLTITLLLGSSWGMVYFQYHTWSHLWGGVLAAVCTLGAFYGAMKLNIFHENIFKMALLLVLITIPMLLRICYASGYEFYVDRWSFWGILSGFSLGWFIQNKYPYMSVGERDSLYVKVISVVIVCLGLYVTYYYGGRPLEAFPDVISFMGHGLLIGLWPSLLAFWLVRCISLLFLKSRVLVSR